MFIDAGNVISTDLSPSENFGNGGNLFIGLAFSGADLIDVENVIGADLSFLHQYMSRCSYPF